MARSQYTRAQVLELGMLALKRCPEVCAELLIEIDEFNSPAFDNDLNNISNYFSIFCNYNQVIDFKNLVQKKWSRKRGQQFKVFIAAMIRIYKPLRYTYSGIVLMPGFSLNLARVLELHGPNISKLVKEVDLHQKAYEDFRDEVDYTEHYLKLAKEKYNFG